MKSLSIILLSLLLSFSSVYAQGLPDLGDLDGIEDQIEEITGADCDLKIKGLATEPRPFNCIKLTNEEKYRIRVGDYRVLYEIIDDILVINVVKVKHRREVYRKNK